MKLALCFHKRWSSNSSSWSIFVCCFSRRWDFESDWVYQFLWGLKRISVCDSSLICWPSNKTIFQASSVLLHSPHFKFWNCFDTLQYLIASLLKTERVIYVVQRWRLNSVYIWKETIFKRKQEYSILSDTWYFDPILFFFILRRDVRNGWI